MARSNAVRVSSGALKGRKLRYPPPGLLRPTTARTREAVFDSLRAEVHGAVFVDLYAAAGAVGIEALSRGAAFVHFVERGEEALACLRDNVAACGLDPATFAIHATEVEAFIASGGLGDARIGVIYADPPYDPGAAETLLALLDEKAYPHVRRLLVEHRGPAPSVDLRRWKLLRTKRFGDTGVSYLEPLHGGVR